MAWSSCVRDKMEAGGLAYPGDLGPEEVMGLVYSIGKAVQLYGAGVTVETIVAAGAVSEALVVVGAVGAAYYAGYLASSAAQCALAEGWDFLDNTLFAEVNWLTQYMPNVETPTHEETSMRSSSTAQDDAPPAIPDAPEIQEGCGPANADWVRHLQELLQYRGLYSGNVDGDFRWRTTEAVKAFQSQAGLDVDGVVGAKTWAALMS